MLRPVFHVTRRALSYRALNERGTEFLKTRVGRYVKLGILGGTIVLYPIGLLIADGPLVKFTFPWRYPCEPVPAQFERLLDEEYALFLLGQGRKPEDAVNNFHLLTDAEKQDSVARGSLGVRTGLEVALPFFFTYYNAADALCDLRQRFPKSLPQFGENIEIDWDSRLGKMLAETFVLSDEARRFLVQRDLLAHDGYAALGQRSLTYATFTAFSGLLVYAFHSMSNLFKGSFTSFVVFYCLFTAAAIYGSHHWHLLYRYITDIHADSTSARLSSSHSAGGREYYYKWLKRNRILRELCDPLYTKVTWSGDVRGIPTKIVTRYDLLKDADEDDVELSDVVGGDF
ncbi:unnamed protein product, partial [Mesorhabditis spiculigera]